jgi:AraC-like DNA-binding protein
VGFTWDELSDPNARHPLRDVARLWHVAAVLAQEPSFSLRVPRYARHTSFHALGYAMFASGTVEEAVRRAVRYSGVLSDGGVLQLESSGPDDVASLSVVPGLMADRMADAFRDSLLSLAAYALGALGPGALTLRKVVVQRERPKLHVYERHFQCSVEVGAVDALVFDAARLKHALPAANLEVAHHNDVAVREYLARMQAGSLVDRVRAAIAARAKDEVSPELIARSLGMSVRSLQRNLNGARTSYEELLVDVKCELACAYLRDDRYSVTEVAYALGYDSLSAFARAFKRWTGQSPSGYQQGESKRIGL